MKKILLFLCCLPMLVAAQIGSIHPAGMQFERASKCMIRYTATNEYALVLCDNVKLQLGNGPTAAANSLANLHDVIYNNGQTFSLQGHDFIIRDKAICLQTEDVCITSEQLCDEMVTLITELGADFGDLSIVIGYEPLGHFYIGFDTYGFVQLVSIGFDVSDRLSHKYEMNEPLTPADVRVLRDAISDNYMSVKNGALAMMICDVILGEF